MVATLGLLFALTLPGSDPEPGTLLTYRGTFLPVKTEAKGVGKSFELRMLIAKPQGETTAVYWYLTDSAGKPIAWSERFGSLQWSAETHTTGGQLPSFSYAHGIGTTQIQIAPPLSPAGENVTAGTRWADDNLQWVASAGDPFQGHDTLDITARMLIGRSRTLTIDADSQRVYRLRENVFVGQGDEHLLKYELISDDHLDDAALERSVAAFQAWSDARDGWKQNSSASNRELLKLIPDLKKKSSDTPLASLAATVASQLKSGEEQSAAAQAQREKLIGKKLPAFALDDVAKKAWSNESLEDRVTVLHLWSYRDDGLHEPYGQVGYLDYLARRHDTAKLQVLGVAVKTDKEEDVSARRAAIRRFRDFMNVSYPILLDDGALLKQLGGAIDKSDSSPLFVVIDRQGKIVEYKAGLYEVQRDQGLTQLEAIVKQAAAQPE